MNSIQLIAEMFWFVSGLGWGESFCGAKWIWAGRWCSGSTFSVAGMQTTSSFWAQRPRQSNAERFHVSALQAVLGWGSLRFTHIIEGRVLTWHTHKYGLQFLTEDAAKQSIFSWHKTITSIFSMSIECLFDCMYTVL